jgi:hypothetical protein
MIIPTELSSGENKNKKRNDQINIHLAFFFELSNHDDDGTVFVPHHLPEVNDCVRHGALGRDVRSGLSLIALNTPASQSSNRI